MAIGGDLLGLINSWPRIISFLSRIGVVGIIAFVLLWYVLGDNKTEAVRHYEDTKDQLRTMNTYLWVMCRNAAITSKEISFCDEVRRGWHNDR